MEKANHLYVPPSFSGAEALFEKDADWLNLIPLR